MKRKRRQPKPWPLAKLHRECWAAPVVWLALLDMATERGSPAVTPTRDKLAKSTGIRRHKTLSAALTALEAANWIDREHVPVIEGGRQIATMIRVVIRRMPRVVTGTRSRRGRKAPHTAQTPVEGARRPIAVGRKAPQDFPKGKGCPTAPPLSPSGGAERTPGQGSQIEEEKNARPISELVAEVFPDGG